MPTQPRFNRREIARLIQQAKQEDRSFEELFLEMWPEDTSSDDDCRPLDSLSTDASLAPQDTERLAAIALLKGVSANGDQIAGAQTDDSQDSPYIRDLEDQALHAYNRHLVLEVLDIWTDQLYTSSQHAHLADQRYDDKVLRKCFGLMKEEFYQTEDLERKRRLKMFLAWKDRKLAISAIQSWIIRHRENVVKKRAEDRLDVRAVTLAIGNWRLKAAESQQGKERFRGIFYASKFGRRWLDVVSERRISRAMAILEQKYHVYRREKDRKLLQMFFSGWSGSLANIAAIEVTADNHLQQSQAQRSKIVAHDALSSMYMSTAESKSMEATADEQYQKTLMLRVLSKGQWRVKTQVTQEREEVADEFRTIRDQAKAQRGFRNMRKVTAWGKQMNDEADAYYRRTSSHLGRQMIRKWRIATANKRGEVVVREPPATPAARMSALRQYQQNQR